MKLNKKIVSEKVYTEEGGKAVKVNDYLALKRSVLATFLWESGFYESGEDIVTRIKNLVPKVNPIKVAALAIEARNEYKLRHIPLLLTRELARNNNSRYLVANTLAQIIQRPDELGEFLKLYNLEGKQPLAAQVKKGLASAFKKFSEYDLQKYNRDAEYKLKDVLFLCHAKPEDKKQEKLWKKLINDELKTPDTWEVQLSASQGEDKKEIWERLLKQEKLGALALLRNLRNMKELGVNEKLIVNALENINVEKVLPFRFIAAARYYPALEDKLEKAMFKCVENHKKNKKDKVVLLIDVSGSMDGKLSSKSDMSRLEAACGLAILARELYENVNIYTFSLKTVEIPNRRGFALRDAIVNSQVHNATHLGEAITHLNEIGNHDKLIVFTDEQSQQAVPNPICENAYMINVANNKNGVGYKGNWTHLDGFSESIFNYINEIENCKE